jgi:hypothetical protein
MRRMRGALWVLAGALVGGLISWLALRPPGPRVPVLDLVAELPRAKETRPSAGAFRAIDATIGGTTRRSILVTETSRLVYTVSVPEHAVLSVSVGLAEEAWTTEGDGVLFRLLIGAPDERDQIEVLYLLLRPFSTPADRTWRAVDVDLADYAGRTIDLFFNTNAGLPGGDDTRGDLALWGAPRIMAPEP